MDELPPLPKGWAWSTIGEITEPSKERVNPAKLPQSNYIGLEHIESSRGRLLGRGAATEVKSSKTRFRTGDLLYGKLRPYLNKVYVAEFDGICSTDILVFPKSQFVYSKYLLFRVLRDDFVRYANLNVSGVQHPRVDIKTVSQFPIPLAPLAEQRRIVTKIEELFSDLDAGVSELEKAKAQLRRYRQAVLKAAVEGKLTAEWRAANKDKIEPASVLLERIRAERAKKANGKAKAVPPVNAAELGELPEGWEWTSFEGILCELKNGFFYGRAHTEPPGIPILRINAVRPLSVSFDDLRYVPVNEGDVVQYVLRNGDLLFTRYNGTLDLVGVCGEVNGVGDCVIYPDKLIRARVFGEYTSPHYLELYFASSAARDIIEHKAKTTAGQQGISGADLRAVPIAIPPLAEQHQIVAEVERRLSVADEIAKTVDASLKQAERLRQSILKRAFEGKLVPQDPGDEPAERLLDRIRAQRELLGRGSARRGTATKGHSR